MELEKHEESIVEETIDIKSYLRHIVKVWYLFPISIAIALTIGYFVYVQSPRKFNASSTILIKKDNKSVKSDDLMKGFGLFNNQQNVENEIGILKSHNLAEATIKNSNHFVSYYIKNRFRKDNIYQESPFIVLIDPGHPQLIGSYDLEFTGENSFTLTLEKMDDPKRVVYDFSNYKPIKTKFAISKHSFNGKYGEWIETSWMKIRIDARPDHDAEIDEKKSIYNFEITDLQTLSAKLKNAIKAEPANKMADIINLSIIWDNIDEGVVLLSEFMDQYSIQNLKEKNIIASSTIDFIDAQIDVLSDTLSSDEYKLESFRRSNKVINVDVQAQGAYTQSQRIGTDISMSELRLKYFKYLEEYLKSQNEYKDIVTPAVVGVSDPLLNKLITDLYSLSSEKSKLLFNTTNDNPLVININKQISETKKAIFETIQSLNSSTLIEIGELKRNLNVFDKELLKIPETERSLIGIQRSFKINNDIYTFLLQKRAESAIAKASNIADSQIIDDARANSLIPISPKKSMIFLIAFFIGLLIPMIYIFIKKNLFDYIETKDELKHITKIPFISSIPHSNFDTNTVMNDYPKSEVAEAYRTLRTKLGFMLNNSNRCNTIVISSSIPGEGKTFNAVNLATSFAITNKKAIIIGLDLRRPGLKNIFDSHSHHQTGMSTFLSGQTAIGELIIPSGIDHLDYIPAGAIPPNPSELIGNKRFIELMDHLKTIYDIIIIDTPPINIVSDALLVFPFADAILYVIRSNYSRKRFLDEINHLYFNQEVKNIAFIFNDDEKGNVYQYGSKYSGNYIENNQKSLIQKITSKFSNK